MKMPTRVVIVASGGHRHALARDPAPELSKDRLFVTAALQAPDPALITGTPCCRLFDATKKTRLSKSMPWGDA
ncbi:hypothetical protein [Catellatospora tritici]|uniref:hypothetical protein n=1 Tax=Catellatospora tritici TaxID=2851566 RepID=UPI001C2D8639|nr:hypothetical protein [Catellatospora tritici]MBV1849989.1 hypothetical protein [Catellatospora tritici]